MKNKQNIIILGIAFFVIAIGITAYMLMQNRASAPTTNTARNDSASSDTSHTGHESETYKKYAALKGEEYDKQFIANMIVHHESAMNMAEMATASAERQEIKDLAVSIAQSQGMEVSEMVTWQKQWGYPETSGHMMVDGGGNTSHSMEGMATMNNELKGLEGDAFDKKFLGLMVVHHQEAIEMAKPAETNAYHQEIKNLAKAVISAQSSEIDQMQRWQRGWGFEVTNPDASSSVPSMHH